MLRTGLTAANVVLRPQQLQRALRPALSQHTLTPLAARALPPLAARGLATSPLLLRRDDDRLPRGHVRPARRPRRRDDTPEQFPGQAYPGSAYPGGPVFDAGMGFQPSPEAYGGYKVVVPDDPHGVLKSNHAAYDLLAHDSLVVVRQLEMLNVFMGYEQANKYAIYTSAGELVGYLAEEERGFAGVFARQMLHTHRPFKSTVMDRTGRPILWIQRPFAFINSRIKVYADEGAEGAEAPIVGETQQQWHPWRRRYNLFENRPAEHAMEQFARIDGGFLAWDFWLKDRNDRLLATINRNFSGFGREIFTDTGQYVIRFDAAGQEVNMPAGSEINVQGQTIILPEHQHSEGLTLDQRAMALATAVSIDFDYFSRHSGSGGGFLPFYMFGGGDGSSEARREGSGETGPAPTTTGGIGGAGVGDIGGAAAAGAAMGAGNAGNAGAAQRDWTDDEIYGRAPQPDGSARWDGAPAAPPQEPPVPGQQAEGFDYPYEFPGDVPGPDEEMMQDPWANPGGDGGLFGGSGGGGGGGGGWGDWGDWS